MPKENNMIEAFNSRDDIAKNFQSDLKNLLSVFFVLFSGALLKVLRLYPLYREGELQHFNFDAIKVRDFPCF